MRCGDFYRAELVMVADTALDAKKIGNQVTPSDQWFDTRDDVMRSILDAKLAQCKDFSEALVKSNKNTIFVESVYDNYWGSGLDRKGTLNTDSSRWPGKNELGRIFTEMARCVRVNQASRPRRNTMK